METISPSIFLRLPILPPQPWLQVIGPSQMDLVKLRRCIRYSPRLLRKYLLQLCLLHGLCSTDDDDAAALSWKRLRLVLYCIDKQVCVKATLSDMKTLLVRNNLYTTAASQHVQPVV